MVIGELVITFGEKEEVDYCGPTKGKPIPVFNPWRDILVGDFMVVKLVNKEDHVWMRCTLIVVERETTSTLYGNFKLQW